MKKSKELLMNKNLVAKASITINVPVSRVWQALVTPADIKQYMFGANTVSEWREGSPIYWRGEWQGKPYEDKGVILQIKPERTLQYNNFSPLSGAPDKPENYQTVTIELTDKGKQTVVNLSQDNNASDEEREHSEQNWGMVLAGMKKYLEG
jgi:uncharacterized protein YndB with AHSA1/START domain